MQFLIMKLLFYTLLNINLCVAHNLFSQKQKYISTALAFKQTLRICNAYPFSAGGVSVLENVISYKNCADIDHSLTEGDQIDFHSGSDISVLVGSFEVSELPKNDALLLLVLQPHDDISTGVKFQSHIFSNSDDAQVALLDAYAGPILQGTDNMITIADKKIENPKYEQRKEELNFNTVVAVNNGDYEVYVKGDRMSKKYLHAHRGTKYSIVRVGVASSEADKIAYPEDLIVFPAEDKSLSITTWIIISLGCLFVILPTIYYFMKK